MGLKQCHTTLQSVEIKSWLKKKAICWSFFKVNQEIEILKAKFASKQASENLSASKGNNEQNQVSNVNSASQSTITPSWNVREANVSHNMSTCIHVANVKLSHVNSTAVVNASSEMSINRDTFSEIIPPSFVDCNKQSVVTLMLDIGMYFELRKVPENLKLALVLRAIKDSRLKLV